MKYLPYLTIVALIIIPVFSRFFKEDDDVPADPVELAAIASSTPDTPDTPIPPPPVPKVKPTPNPGPEIVKMKDKIEMLENTPAPAPEPEPAKSDEPELEPEPLREIVESIPEMESTIREIATPEVIANTGTVIEAVFRDVLDRTGFTGEPKPEPKPEPEPAVKLLPVVPLKPEPPAPKPEPPAPKPELPAPAPKPALKPLPAPSPKSKPEPVVEVRPAVAETAEPKLKLGQGLLKSFFKKKNQGDVGAEKGASVNPVDPVDPRPRPTRSPLWRR